MKSELKATVTIFCVSILLTVGVPSTGYIWSRVDDLERYVAVLRVQKVNMEELGKMSEQLVRQTTVLETIVKIQEQLAESQERLRNTQEMQGKLLERLITIDTINGNKYRGTTSP